MLFLSNEYEDVIKHLGDGLPRSYGSHLLLKLYTREDATQGGVLLPESVREEEIYQTIVGLVLDKGPDCYGDEMFAHWKQPSVGEWVLFRPNSGVRFNYDGVPLRFVYDDCVICRVKNPELIRR